MYFDFGYFRVLVRIPYSVFRISACVEVSPIHKIKRQSQRSKVAARCRSTAAGGMPGDAAGMDRFLATPVVTLALQVESRIQNRWGDNSARGRKSTQTTFRRKSTI